jgi:branched-chain amino acid aminotransferase
VILFFGSNLFLFSLFHPNKLSNYNPLISHRINFNGQIHAGSHLTLSAGNRAFRYGDGCIENLCKTKGEFPLLRYHLQRLYRNSAVLQIKLPAEWTLSFWQRQFEMVSEDMDNALLRLTVFRSEGGDYRPTDNTGQFILEATSNELPAYQWEPTGLSVAICSTVRLQADNILSNIKSCNALPYVLAGLFNHSNQLGDCLLLNQHERLAETSQANIFLFADGQLSTPPLTEGCIDGVMRRFLLEEAPKAGWSIIEKPLRPADLRKSSEVLLTNSVSGIKWVKLFGDRNFGHQEARKMQDWLHETL